MIVSDFLVILILLMLGELIIVDPAFSFTFEPHAYFDDTLTRKVFTLSMLLTVLPKAVVLATIGPLENAMAFFLVINILTFVSSAIRPCEDTFAMHFVFSPRASEDTTICPRVNTLPLDVVVIEISSVS
jgi:hypothetical protein